jgi:outer membrane protein W
LKQGLDFITPTGIFWEVRRLLELGAHVVAGVNFNITKRFFIGVDGKYFWTDTVSITQRVADIPITYTGDLNGYTINFAFGFRF